MWQLLVIVPFVLPLTRLLLLVITVTIFFIVDVIFLFYWFVKL